MVLGVGLGVPLGILALTGFALSVWASSRFNRFIRQNHEATSGTAPPPPSSIGNSSTTLELPDASRQELSSSHIVELPGLSLQELAGFCLVELPSVSLQELPAEVPQRFYFIGPYAAINAVRR